MEAFFYGKHLRKGEVDVVLARPAHGAQTRVAAYSIRRNGVCRSIELLSQSLAAVRRIRIAVMKSSSSPA